MLNSATLQGRLVRDVELRQTTSGLSVCTFTIAVDRDYKTGGEKKADFINCVAWRNTAEFMTKYFSKGQEILLTGSIQVREYTDKAGDKKYATEVVADKVFFCGKKEAIPSQTPETYEQLDADDALPF